MHKYQNYSYLDNHEKINIKKFKQDKQNLKVEEYRLWHTGDINKILEYYKTGRDSNGYGAYKINYTPSFMRLAPTGYSNDIGGATQANNFTVYHIPVANIISRTMANLLFATEPKYNITSKTLPPTTIAELTENFETILKENQIGTSLQLMSEIESYSGAFAIKPIIDPDFSDTPIIQVYSKDEFILNTKYDRIISIIFIDEFKAKGATAKSQDVSLYLLSEYGYGYIKYAVVDGDGKKKSLLDYEYTSSLNDLYFYDQDNKPVDILLAIYKENKPDAKSDYDNSLDDFNAIDETYSNMMNYIRKTAPKRIVSSNTFKKTDEGTPIVPSVYGQDLVVLWNDVANAQQETNTIQATPEMNNAISAYISAMREIYENIGRTVGLSSKTILGDTAAGANASGEAIALRENIDLRTRENKLIGWKESLDKLYRLLLILNSSEYLDESYVKVNLYKEVEILTEFYNPATPSFSEEVNEVKSLLDAGLIDEYTALRRIWYETGRKSEEEVEQMWKAINGQRNWKPEPVKIDIPEETEEDEDDKEEEDDVE